VSASRKALGAGFAPGVASLIRATGALLPEQPDKADPALDVLVELGSLLRQREAGRQ
jgi:hypothetical protein